MTLCLPGLARAQLGLSLSASSDYRFRGVSLSQGKPNLTLNVTYDDRSGVYLGATAIAAEGVHGGVRILGYLEYAGFTAPVNDKLAWDVGLSNATLSQRPYNNYNVDYVEAFAGLVSRNVNFHVYYSPNYVGDGFSAVYLDLNGAVRPAPGWRLFAHAGALSPVGGGVHREYYDLRAGVAAAFRNTELQLAWTSNRPSFYYPPGIRQKQDALVVSASYFF